MKFFLVVICAVIGTVHSRSLPIGATNTVVEVESLSGNPVYLIRKARQFGGVYGNRGYYRGNVGNDGGGNYNDFDYNPYNDSPINYDGNPFNDLTHRQLYNNFDRNPYNNSPNDYDDNYFKRRFNL